MAQNSFQACSLPRAQKFETVGSERAEQIKPVLVLLLLQFASWIIFLLLLQLLIGIFELDQDLLVNLPFEQIARLVEQSHV